MGSAVALAGSYEFGRHRRLLDLGGGTGSFLVPILERHPEIECGLFELPLWLPWPAKTSRLASPGPNRPPVCACSSSPPSTSTTTCTLRAGGSGFLLKDTPPADLLAAIRVVAADDALLAPAVTRRLIAEFARRPEPGQQPAATLEGITDREREVLILIARGLSNAEIAHTLHVTMATAKTHVGRLLAKLGARDRAQLVIVAYETGLVQAGSQGGEPGPFGWI